MTTADLKRRLAVVSGMALDWLYPSVCAVCEEVQQQGRTLCAACDAELPRLRAPFCSRCGEHFEGRIDDDFTCPNCSKLKFAFEFARANGRKKVVVAGLWTEVCNTTFALCAMLEGDYEIYMVADASGGTSKDAHDFAMQRMVQAGAVPVTWQQVLLEWQRDWAHRDTYDAVIKIVTEHSGAYGMGVDYAYTMVHKAPARNKGENAVLAPVPAR